VLQWFSNCFMYFFVSVSDACFKRFICLRMDGASVVSGYFKSRSDVVSSSSPSVASPSAALHPSQIREGCARGWRHRRERMLFPSVTRAGSASIYFFSHTGMLRPCLVSKNFQDSPSH
jgi:hypothetical protein